MRKCLHHCFVLSTILAVAVAIAGAGTVLAAEDFTVVLIPDTQRYVEQSPINNIYSAQTQWIKDNAQAENIKFAVHLGDIVEHRNEQPSEWQIADAAHDILDAGPNPVPYSMVPGNHDILGSGSPDYLRDATLYNQTFGPDRFAGKAWYGGHRGTGNENNYSFFSGGDDDFMVLSLEPLPTDDTLAWANGIVQANPDRRVILATHIYLNPNGTRSTDRIYAGMAGNNANDIFDKLIKNNSNIFMVVNGHLCYEGLNVATNSSGGKVYEIVSDYQNATNGGNGWLRTLKFQPDDDKITVGSYSPTLDQQNLYGSFDLPYDTSGNVDPPDPPQPAELVSYWNFENDGRAVVGDHNLTLHDGATIVEGRMGNGLHVTNSGSNGYASAPADDDLNMGSEFSVAMWLKYESGNDAYGRVISRMEDAQNGYNIAFAGGTASSSALIIRLMVGGANYFVTMNEQITRDQFHHIAFSYDDDAGFSATDKIKVWIDGAAVTSLPSSGGGVQGTPEFVLGKGTATSADFAGVLDEVRFYTGVLSQSDVTAMQNPIFPGDANYDGRVDESDAAALAANWMMESGATWTDGDFDGNGRVDDRDATILAANWQNDIPQVTVPEPGVCTLIMGIAIGLSKFSPQFKSRSKNEK